MADQAVGGGEQAAPPPVTAAPAGRSRASRGIRDILWSMAVVMAVVLFLLLVTKRPTPDPVRVIDYGTTLALARAQAEYPVLAPTALGPDWRATSARWEPTAASGDVPAWHLGMVAPDDTYVQVSQAAIDPADATAVADYVDEQTAAGRPDGTSVVAGRTYERRLAPDPEQRSLVAVSDAGVTVITGTASWETLEAFAGALQGG